MATTNEEYLEKKGNAIAGTKGGTASGQGNAIVGTPPVTNAVSAQGKAIVGTSAPNSGAATSQGNAIAGTPVNPQSGTASNKGNAISGTPASGTPGATANNYAIDYNDQRFGAVEADKAAAMKELDSTYSGMIDQSDQFYQDQINASKEWADKQSQLQQEQTDFAISEIEQQKDQAQKDYIREQSGAYVDWQKKSDQYGANAEAMAASGLTNTGFSESSQVSMYNTYQSRVAAARESYNLAVQNYNNAITEARLQNNSILAEIAFEALRQQLELSLEGFQYKNTLIQTKADKKMQLDSEYYSRYQDVLAQINHENAMAEEIRQHNETHALQVKQFDEEVRQFNQEYALKQQQYKESIRQFNEEIARLKKKDDHEAQMQVEELELKKKQVEQEKKQWEAEMRLKKDQLAEEKRQFDETMSYNKSKSKSSGGGGGSDDDLYQLDDGNEEGNNPDKQGSWRREERPNSKTVESNVKYYVPSQSVKNKIKSLESMQGMTGSKQGIANSIVAYAQTGQMTMEDAEYMLKYFGYKVSDFME